MLNIWMKQDAATDVERLLIGSARNIGEEKEKERGDGRCTCSSSVGELGSETDACCTLTALRNLSNIWRDTWNSMISEGADRKVGEPSWDSDVT